MSEPTIQVGILNLHAAEASGVLWVTEKVTGWDDGPASTSTPTRKPRSHGAWVGTGYKTPRHVSVEGYVQAATVDLVEDALDRLKSAVALEDTTLSITRGSAARSATVRRSDQILTDLHERYATWSIQLLAADPRKFGAELTDSTGLPSSSGGLSIPFTIPFSIGATTTSGQVSLTNAGNATGPVRLRIDGPVVGPVVTHVASGLSLVFATSLTIGPGEHVIVDLERHEVMAMGQTGRNGWVTGRGWFGFEPGVNVFSFSAVSGSGTLTVWATEAWE